MTATRQRTAVAAGGGGVGVLIVWILDLAGVPVTPAAAAVLAGMATTVAVALGRDGIHGVLHRLWRGVNGDSPGGPGNPTT